MRFLFAVAALVLAGCQTPCPPAPRVAETHRYGCDDGSTLVVTFNARPGYAAIEQEGFAPLELPEDIISAGYHYSEGGADLRGQGREAAWQRPGSAPTQCQEIVATP